jgi:hypothetical protein
MNQLKEAKFVGRLGIDNGKAMASAVTLLAV